MKFPIVPQEIRLQVPRVPKSFTGRLYFALGPGLGDALNDLRILHQVLALYPNARPVVYADPRWKNVYDCIPDLRQTEVRYYSSAPSAAAREQQKAPPYHHTFRGVVQEIVEECSRGPGWVAVAGFRLDDQLTRKEPSLMMRARAIGLSLKEKECRPYFPLPLSALADAKAFLQAHGLQPGQYLVIAPHTWADKAWEDKSWRELVESLHKVTGLPILIVGVPGYLPLRGPAVHEALGLPIPVVAALISQGRCYVGLDSGPTHLAACFDIPIVALNPQGKFPPFLVEPHSPYKWIHLTPGLYGQEPIPAISVFEIACKALDRFAPPSCPACSDRPYVLGAGKAQLLYLCRCGLIFREGATEADDHEGLSPLESGRYEGSVFPFPVAAGKLNDLRVHLDHLKGQDKPLLLSLDHWDPVKADPFTLLRDSTGRTLWWNWDSAYSFLARSGWQVVGSELKPTRVPEAASYAVTLKVVPSNAGPAARLFKIPWGDHIVTVPRNLYEGWLSWGAFRNQGELEGLGWSLLHQGEKASGRFILKTAFKIQPRWRSLRRFILATLTLSRRR